jgi:hypothetical protein
MQPVETVRRLSFALLWMTIIAALVQVITG